MDRYIGLDAHASSCTLAVVGPSGKRLGSHVVETNARALIEVHLSGEPAQSKATDFHFVFRCGCGWLSLPQGFMRCVIHPTRLQSLR